MKTFLITASIIALTGVIFINAPSSFAHPHENDSAPYKKIVKDPNHTIDKTVDVDWIEDNIDGKPDVEVFIIEDDSFDSRDADGGEAEKLPQSTEAKVIEKHLETYSKSLKEKFDASESQHTRAVKKFKQSYKLDGETLLDDPEALSSAARDLEVLIAESGVISNMADILAGIVQDIEVENNRAGMALFFDGVKLGSFNVNEENDGLDVDAMGRNMTIEKEVTQENGKTKTRIIIEMDGNEDVDIDVKSKSKKSGF